MLYFTTCSWNQGGEKPGGQEVCSSISASRDLVADRQLQLFQPFHLWHTLPGFSLAAFCRRDQKAASLTRASLLNVFFTCFTSSSLTSRNRDLRSLLPKGLNPNLPRRKKKSILFCMPGNSFQGQPDWIRDDATARGATMTAVRKNAGNSAQSEGLPEYAGDGGNGAGPCDFSSPFLSSLSFRSILSLRPLTRSFNS